MKLWSLRTLAFATVFAVLAGMAPAATAQVSFDGVTSGSFNGNDFVFTGADIAGTLDVGESWDGSFGTFSRVPVTRPPSPVTPATLFELIITFYSPASAQTLFTAILGRFDSDHLGDTRLFFDGPVRLAAGNSVFEISADNALITSKQNSAVVSGSILRLEDSTTVPEPISMALLGTGLAGVAAARRRRRNAVTELE